MNWFAFLMTVGSMSRSLTRMGSKNDLIKLKPYFALLKRNTGKTLQKRSRVSWRSFNWFFCMCNFWVEAQVSISQSFWLMSNFAFFRLLWRWVSFSRMLPSLIFIVVLISKKKLFIFVLLWRANLSRAPIKEVTRWWRSELQKKLVLSLELRRWKPKWKFVLQSILLCGCLWGCLLVRKLIQSGR